MITDLNGYRALLDEYEAWAGCRPGDQTLIAVLDPDGYTAIYPLSPVLVDDPDRTALLALFNDLLDTRQKKKKEMASATAANVEETP